MKITFLVEMMTALWINLIVYRFWVKRKSWKYFLLFIKFFIPTKHRIPNGMGPLCSFVMTIADTGYQNQPLLILPYYFFRTSTGAIIISNSGYGPGNCLVFIKLIKYSTIIFWSVQLYKYILIYICLNPYLLSVEFAGLVVPIGNILTLISCWTFQFSIYIFCSKTRKSTSSWSVIFHFHFR